MTGVSHSSKKESNCWQNWTVKPVKRLWASKNQAFHRWYGAQENTLQQGPWRSKRQEWQDSMAEQSQGKAPIPSGKASTNFISGFNSSWAPSCGFSSQTSEGSGLPLKNGLLPKCFNGDSAPGTTKYANSFIASAPGDSPVGPFFLRLRERIKWWQKHTNNPHVLDLIKNGVTADGPLPNKLSTFPCVRNHKETQLAWETIQEYLEVQAIKEIHPSEAKHLIPWFVIPRG
jgi:hypothetical protein